MKSLCRSLLITLLLCLAWASWSNAANVRLEHADSLATTQTPTGMDYEFFGNVHFVRDSSDLYSDYAVRQEPSNTVRFLGNVKMREPQRTLTADSVWYDQRTDLLRAWGKVVIEDRLRHVRAAGGAATYEGTQDYLLLIEHPRLMVDFDLPQTVTTVSGDTIKYHERDDLVEAIDSAIITQGTLVAHSQQATIFLDREEICLTGNVRASQRQNELSDRKSVV
jgi:lipopolysaccharide export system protein LptA